MTVRHCVTAQHRDRNVTTDCCDVTSRYVHVYLSDDDQFEIKWLDSQTNVKNHNHEEYAGFHFRV